MNLISEAVAYINPMLFYYVVAYIIGKLSEVLLKTENIWQIIWDKVMDTFGDSIETYSVWVLNSYAYAIYWTLGAALIAMEIYGKPKGLKKYKIQKDKDELKDGHKLNSVSNYKQVIDASLWFMALEIYESFYGTS